MGGKVPTYEEIMAMYAESAKRSAEIDKQLAETIEGLAEVKKMMAENAKRSAETDRKFAAIQKELGGLGENNGLVAEEIVFHSLSKRMSFAGIDFDFIERGLQRERKLPDGKKVRGEYDVVLSNGTAAAIIEVKYRVGKEALNRLVEVQLPRFRVVFPEYKDFKMYLGLGGMSFEKGVEEEARKLGIATLMLNGEAVEVNDENVKAW